jgi:hypothetical protein
LRLTETSLDEWREDRDTFRLALLTQCLTLAKSVGLYFDFDQSALHDAHSKWASRCHEWEAAHLAESSNGLSHLKILAILLTELAGPDWVREPRNYEIQDRDWEFSGPPALRAQIRQLIIDGEGAWLAVHFVTQIVNGYESSRIDRLGAFEFRMTPALEHDLIVYLKSGHSDAKAVYLILKALYARHPREEFAHGDI